MNCRRFLSLLAMAMAVAMAIPSSSQQQQQNGQFVFNGFLNNASNMHLSGIAVLEPSGSIQLTNLSSRVLGHALYRFPLPIKTVGSDNRTITSSFSTTFVFSVSPLAPSVGGHGLAFFITPTLDDSEASPVQYMGLLNSSDNGNPSNHLFAVEFDTVQDVDFNDINDNHIGIDINSMVSVESVPATYRTSSDPNQTQPLNLKSGQNIQAWIHYDGLQQQLKVSIANVGQTEPLFPLLSVPLNLSSVLEDTVYVGFSASTGDISSVQRILAWSFNSNGSASPLDLASLPVTQSTAPTGSSALSNGAIAGISLLAVTLFCAAFYALLSVYRRQQRLVREKLEEAEWEIEYGPHMFSYKELSEATNGFADERLVGQGGCGAVYRGILPSTGLEVAVKRLSNQSRQGMREFMAELSTMGRLSHRNLVQLQGWCRPRGSGELLLVYDYMPNGSLYKMLLHGTTTATTTATTSTIPLPLSWAQRYNILKDVAAALVYLHEEWEQQVLHRDVKSNNILLDANLNAKLGDFGLARLHAHGENSHNSSLVVGTLGYIAPEYSSTGKATVSCDVFSFGAVMLEVASGRRPLDFLRPDEEVVLVDWVLQLFLKGRILEASDPRLSAACDSTDGVGYVEEEMECVLQLGLICSNPNPIARPTMRQVLQILTGSAPLPVLLPFKPID